MESKLLFMIISMLVVWCSTLVNSQFVGSPPISSPTPAPALEHVNLIQLLSYAGPFHTFLKYLEKTKVLETFQDQANNTEEGITIFAPTDDAFSKLKNPFLSNLIDDQIKSILLFHALSHYYSLSDFKNLSQMSPVITYASGQYTLNFTDVSGDISIDSRWTKTKVSSSVVATDPIAVYEIKNVLLQKAIFGTDIPPTVVPAPAPHIAPSADTPVANVGGSNSSPKSSPSSSCKISNLAILTQLILAIASGVVLMFS
ncbi:fasciclin-like arabinogalactan protein 7 [Coffea arabica]|uniref:Fasciclin-like arabinogalactan protein 7 n=1 Tax=Coffea arabica TaxID=13443 RepID=A0A6P6VHI7_COFAR|nr:fasciclin-like arabinogalactan protein 7 [Coffea arabica]